VPAGRRALALRYNRLRRGRPGAADDRQRRDRAGHHFFRDHARSPGPGLAAEVVGPDL